MCRENRGVQGVQLVQMFDHVCRRGSSNLVIDKRRLDEAESFLRFHNRCLLA